MPDKRPAAVAGLFYPGSSQELHRMVSAYLAADTTFEPSPSVKALIAPHAGFIYSGPIAASAFRCLQAEADRIHRVVLLGPAHRLPVRGLALSGQDLFETPLGEVPVDRELVMAIEDMPQVSINPEAHAPEHCLEVELPFLQEVLGEFSIVPLLVSDASPEEIAEVLAVVWGREETRIVISSDLSHYLTYEAAQRVDRETAQRVQTLSGEIEPYRACGAMAINGLTRTARDFRLHCRLLDLRNSGDTAGDRQRVVGYGAFSFSELS